MSPSCPSAGCGTNPSFTACADVDGGAGVAQGVRHLVGQGYEQVGYLGWPHGSPVGDDRRCGRVAATTELGIHDPALQEVPPQDLPFAVAAVQSLIKAVGVGGAIVCASDSLAFTAVTPSHGELFKPAVIARHTTDRSPSAHE